MGSETERSPTPWWPRLIARAFILVMALAIAVSILRFGIATSLSRRDPVTATHIAPNNAEIAIAAASAIAGKTMVHQGPEIRRLVAVALDRSVTDPTALELRSLEFDADGDHSREAKLFALSDAMSRRSLPTRLWFIQHAVEKGDFAGALQNFDIALKTSSDAPAVLFPVLARASNDPSLAQPIGRLLEKPSDWRLPFLQYAIGEGDAAAGIADVLMHMHQSSWVSDSQIDNALVAELVSEEAFEKALAVQDRFHPRSASPALVRDGTFTDLKARYPFGWLLEQKGDIGAERTHVAGRPALAFQSLPGGVGSVGTQLLLLKPGSYRLQVKTAISPLDPTAPPLWTVTCAGDQGEQLALVDQPSARDSVARATFAVRSDCPAQWLTLNLRESDVPNGQSGAISAIFIDRLPGYSPA